MAKLQKWVISRSRSRDGLGWHIQARTDDQLSSFAAVFNKDTPLLRQKAADGVNDIFTAAQIEPHVTFNVFGQIRYVNDWDNA